jgi:flagellar hook assembly protein FlgD
VHLRFALPTNGRVRLALYDVSGRLVRTLVDQDETQGWARTADWDGRDANSQAVAAGVYLARLISVSGAAETRIVRLP